MVIMCLQHILPSHVYAHNPRVIQLYMHLLCSVAISRSPDQIKMYFLIGQKGLLSVAFQRLCGMLIPNYVLSGPESMTKTASSLFLTSSLMDFYDNLSL